MDWGGCPIKFCIWGGMDLDPALWGGLELGLKIWPVKTSTRKEIMKSAVTDSDSGPESESMKIYRLRLRLRLRSKLLTPADSDSDSAALVARSHIYSYLWRFFRGGSVMDPAIWKQNGIDSGAESPESESIFSS